ncbi:glycoside hydrolase family 36 protein [Cohnella thailandensis]|uniref:Alpha-galactosidase n=1 Tax=Cohnella thailandensis TaxID=557557 RepID=A0A841STQ2_9BACL|nr:glycoside hydrolase family 36 protein [Cohnella thailandensis]MBB6634379.1 alpha-galactosidase [Cohnella thailandensis]MBP1972122.1 alpha-galactosidase [Cohnella thailandensis]
MAQTIQLEENGLYLVLKVTDEQDVRLLHFGTSPLDVKAIGEKQEEGFRLLELQLSGDDRAEYHGRTHRATFPGLRMRYAGHTDTRNGIGRKLEIAMTDPETKLKSVSHLQFYTGTSVVRAWTVLVNEGEESVGVEYVSSFALTGIDKEGKLDRDEKLRLSIPHTGWQSEIQWRTNTIPELGLSHMTDRSSKRISCSNTGSWAAAEHIPMAVLENAEAGTSLVWQIEHNGSWHWEIIDQFDYLTLLISGPTEHDNHWWKELAPGEEFVSVPVAVGAAKGGFEEAIGELTKYRRLIRRPNDDNRLLRVIFNDYMNCLWGSPTTEKLLPLIDAAAEIGSEYFCIDAGWYAPGAWWDGVGEWLPSRERFPEGIEYVLGYIREKGMIPGLWLELEVMGIRSPKLAEADDSWFFMRHGKRVKDRSRYQLDYRNPAVIAHANEVIRRLVEDYGVGYIKMDYNINAGIGTETDADSFGDGLLQHNRAYLAWLDGIFAKYPDLVIENCSSGGMRMDYAMLSRHSIQSTSDQEDYVKYAQIAASSPSALTPEQSAIWSYPLREGDDEEVVFNMVNALLLRVHQSGHVAELSPRRRALVKEALDYYKTIRDDIRVSLPFWPIGLPKSEDDWVSFGLRAGDRLYVAVWRLGGDASEIALPLPKLAGKELSARITYPAENDSAIAWSRETGELKVTLPREKTARLIELQVR